MNLTPAINMHKPIGLETNMNILQLVLKETDSYDDQYRRVFVPVGDAAAINTVINNVSNAPSITPGVFASTVSGLLQHSSGVESGVSIVNGWKTRRFRFILHLEIRTGVGGRIIEVIQGYTEYNECSFNNSLPPNMLFTINSVMRLRHVQTANQTHTNMIDANQLLCNNNYGGAYTPNQQLMIRPQDMFKMMAVQDWETNIRGGVLTADTIYDHTPHLSRRKNNIATSYLSDVFNGFKNSYHEDPDYPNASTLYTTAANYCSGSEVSSDIFLRTISQLRGLPAVNDFTLNELNAIDPNIRNVIKIVKKDGFGNINTMNFQTWKATDLETVFASTIVSGLGAILMEMSFIGIKLNSTNRIMGMDIATEVSDYQTLVSGNVSPYIQTIIDRFNREIVSPIMNTTYCDYQVAVSCDLSGDTIINISVNGGNFTQYVSPTFADALFTPVVTSSHEHATGMASNLSNILSMTVASANGITYDNNINNGTVTMQNTYDQIPQNNFNPEGLYGGVNSATPITSNYTF